MKTKARGAPDFREEIFSRIADSRSLQGRKWSSGRNSIMFSSSPVVKACHRNKVKSEGLAKGDATIILGRGIRAKAASNARLVPTKNRKLSLLFCVSALLGEASTS